MGMNTGIALDDFRSRLAAFHPQTNAGARALALYSAAIAVGIEEFLNRTIEIGRSHSVAHAQFYEVVLQSYLFLGFPRMLGAAEHLGQHFQPAGKESMLQKISAEESGAWFEDGIQLCRRVYSDSYLSLKQKVEALAPEVFRWMVIEGYGKVLSRPGLSMVDRELAIVACLMIENREKQLLSHIKGAVNVGASRDLVRHVIDDVGEAAGDGYATSLSAFEKLGRS
jgi:4-carboxymuconolactone decarboxylase